MRRFFDLTFRPFFVITGAITALGAMNAFLPRWAVEKIVLIPFNEDYTIILQHWGFMLGLMGVFMIIAAFSVAWRYPILIFCALEKAFVVYLVAVNWNRPYPAAFGPALRWMQQSFYIPSCTSWCAVLQSPCRFDGLRN